MPHRWSTGKTNAMVHGQDECRLAPSRRASDAAAGEERRVHEPPRMQVASVTELLCERHRALQARIAALEVDRRARGARAVQLAEDLVAHATVEQLVVYPYAEELLGLTGLAVEIERSLDAVLGVVGSVDDDAMFAGAVARLSAAFERHVDGDEIGLLPLLELVGPREQMLRIGHTIRDFERALVESRLEGSCVWPSISSDVASRNVN